MIILKGILRQSGPFTPKDGPEKTKLWVEHTTPRENGPDDLKIEEMYLEGKVETPEPGKPIAVAVRPYPQGKSVKYAPVKIVNA